MLGLALASGIALLAPEAVVLGGGMAQPGGVYWRSAEATARAQCRVTGVDRIAFRPVAPGCDAGVVGAAVWGRRGAPREVAPRMERQLPPSARSSGRAA